MGWTSVKLRLEPVGSAEVMSASGRRSSARMRCGRSRRLRICAGRGHGHVGGEIPPNALVVGDGVRARQPLSDILGPCVFETRGAGLLSILLSSPQNERAPLRASVEPSVSSTAFVYARPPKNHSSPSEEYWCTCGSWSNPWLFPPCRQESGVSKTPFAHTHETVGVGPAHVRSLEVVQKRLRPERRARHAPARERETQPPPPLNSDSEEKRKKALRRRRFCPIWREEDRRARECLYTRERSGGKTLWPRIAWKLSSASWYMNGSSMLGPPDGPALSAGPAIAPTYLSRGRACAAARA